MVFGFLRNLNSPEAGHRAMQASYEKHYRMAQQQGIEPVSMGLFGALGSRYKLRRKFISDMVHMTEIAPFMLLPQGDGIRALSDYVLADEIPAQIDIAALQAKINTALEEATLASDAFQMLASASPYLADLPIRWVHWLSETARQRLARAHSQLQDD